jgi:hypothetical protein
MSRVIYKIDENGGAWDFRELDYEERDSYVLPERTGDVETDLYEAEGPLNDNEIFALHLPKFHDHYAGIMMRRVRDVKLWDSDYMAYTDYPHTFTQAWKDHRQALRDIPANNPDPHLDGDYNLINVDWPEEPDWPANTSAM